MPRPAQSSDGDGEKQKGPAQEVKREMVEPGEQAHQDAVGRAHGAVAEWHGEEHGDGAGGEGGPGSAIGVLRGRRVRRELLGGARKNGVVACGADGAEE